MQTAEAMECLEFRVDWGYQFLYSRRQYHPEYVWDGRIDCTGGAVRSVAQLDYPYVWWGVVHSPRETPLPGQEWQSRTRRAMAGIRVVAECGPDAEFTLTTAQGTFRFSAEQIRRDGRIVFPVGPKYSHCTLIVTRQGHVWFRPAPRENEVVVDPPAMRGADRLSFSRMNQVWIEAGTSASFDLTLPSPPSEDGEQCWLVHLQGMTAKDRNDPYEMARDFMEMEFRAGDKSLARVRQFFRFHDMSVQILHDVWTEIPLAALPPGQHTLELVNRHEELPLLVNRISFRPLSRRHLDMSAPRWALTGREFIVRLRVLHPDSQIRLDYDRTVLRLEGTGGDELGLEKGIHELRFVPLQPVLETRIAAVDLRTGARNETAVEAVYDLSPEVPEVQVGYDMTTVPHDDTGIMDWLLDYTHRTQLGNLVCFRPFPMGWQVDPELLERWGRYCREHGIFVQGINLDAGPLPKAAGEFFQGIGKHELSGAVYFKDPDNESRSMKEAAERYVAFVREHVEKTRATAPFVAFGDASGGHRYSLLAGADFLRAETMVPHTMQHLSQARPAAQALGSGEWGVHIAIQHAKEPYLESHLGQYYLSLLQAWMMGARFIYEEDSLFVMFKEERQCWDDALTKGKRDMTRDFFRWAGTHPRPGRTEGAGNRSVAQETAEDRQVGNLSYGGPEVGIGVVLGRYAAPFNGFICGCEQDPGYSVWGQFGRSDDPTWGHRQPEKAAQVLDVLMPGASTHPLRQRYDRRRFYFSGTPYGDFDQVPVEADGEFLSRYRLLLHLGWNTMLPEDYEALKEYVRGGGTLLLATPQLSTHESRAFLDTMDDLALYRDGDVADLCGAKIVGRGVRYCGHWAHTGPAFQGATCPPLSRVPSSSPDEDGPCHLAEVELQGARPVLIDAASGKPMLVEYTLGKGRVYLMTTWAWPGHEELADFSGAVVSRLCEELQGKHRVIDGSGEVFWTWWPHPEHEGCGQLMLLNTDWTKPGNEKPVTVVTPAVSFETMAREGEVRIITCLPFGAVLAEDPEPHVEILEADDDEARLRIHGTGEHRFLFRGKGDLQLCAEGEEDPLAPGEVFALRRQDRTAINVVLRRSEEEALPAAIGPRSGVSADQQDR